jgi:CHASE2 domain-containing sensor protein
MISVHKFQIDESDILSLAMTKNPVINSLAATLYITAVASLMYFGTEHSKPVNSLIVPIAVLSLFSLSAVVMGYLFMYQPILMFLEGKKKPAVTLFLQTVGIFAVTTFLVFGLLFFEIIK